MTRGQPRRRSGPRMWQHVRPPLQVRLEAGGASASALDRRPGTSRGMDPDTALAEALDLAVGILDGEAESVDDIHLASLVVSLDRWLTRGGFMPAARTCQRV